jgi:hypothetical protein
MSTDNIGSSGKADMTFRNSILGGTALIRSAIKSPDFVTGVKGWTIRKDGTAEFNGVVVRGTLSGTNFNINQSGAFFYNGTPTTGNLIGSIVAAPGVDPYGNSYSAIFNAGNQQGAHFGVDRFGTVYVVNALNQAVIQMNPAKQGIFVYTAVPAANGLAVSVASASGVDTVGNGYVSGLTTYDRGQLRYARVGDGEIWLGQLNSGTAAPDLNYSALLTDVAQGQTVMMSSTDATNTDAGRITYRAGQPGQKSGSGLNPFVQIMDNGQNSAVDATISGAMIKSDNSGNTLSKIQPGVGTGPALGTGWATGPLSGNTATCSIRQDAEDNVIIDGALHSTSATPATTLFTLPPGYFNTVDAHREIIGTLVGSTVTQRIVTINTTGTVTITPGIAATSTDVYFRVCAPLGNLP